MAIFCRARHPKTGATNIIKHLRDCFPQQKMTRHRENRENRLSSPSCVSDSSRCGEILRQHFFGVSRLEMMEKCKVSHLNYLLWIAHAPLHSSIQLIDISEKYLKKPGATNLPKMAIVAVSPGVCAGSLNRKFPKALEVAKTASNRAGWASSEGMT